MRKLTTDEVEERDELAAKVVGMFMSGFYPNTAELQRINYLGLDLRAIKEAVDVYYAGEDEA